MKTRLLILILLVISITIPVTSYAEQLIKTEKLQDNFHEGTIEWIIHCNIGPAYSSTVRVTDNDMNKDPEKIEQFNIKVWSDYEDRIVNYVVTEIGNNTGIFESTIFYTTTDSSPGRRIRAFSESIIFAKYVDYTPPKGTMEIDIIDTFVMSEISASGWRDGDMWKITYDPCMIEYLEKNKDNLDWFSIFYPAPLKQIKSGLNNDEIKCKESLELIQKYDKSPVCVKPATVDKLVERGWTDPQTTYFCHLEYLPVCGIEGVTYGNQCFLEKSGVELKHDGKCENFTFPEYQLEETEFLQIKNNMENIGYHICNIQLEENKILIVLNWIFEGSELEKMILSQIPSNVSYEIKYLGGYTDYFITKESVFPCEDLENEN